MATRLDLYTLMEVSYVCEQKRVQKDSDNMERLNSLENNSYLYFFPYKMNYC